jgi:hypothetical protein
MPCFQDSIEEVYPDDQVDVIAINKDSPFLWLLQDYVNVYAPNGYLGYTYPKDILTYPMVWNQDGSLFTAYEASLPSSPPPNIFLIDQSGRIRLRYDGAANATDFWPEFDAIMDSIHAWVPPPNN